jgi:membrane protein required for colicin V production
VRLQVFGLLFADSTRERPADQDRLIFAANGSLGIVAGPLASVWSLIGMQPYDVFMLTVLIAAIAWGAWKGLAWQLASVASIVLSYFVAVNFRAPVARLFHYQPPEWNNFLAMLVLYLGSSLVVWLAFNMVRDFLEKVQLKEFDRQVGGLVGAAKGVLVCTVVTLFTMGLGTDAQRQAVVSSRSGYYIAQLLERVEPLLPAEYQPRLEDTIAQLEQRRGLPQGTYQNGIQLPFSWRQPASGGWSSGSNYDSGGYSSGNYGGWNQQQPSQDAGGWISSQASEQFQRQVLPRIEQEEARLQREIDRYLPPPTDR